MRKCILQYDMDSAYFQVIKYRCGICDDLEFTAKGKCLGHLKEQHAGRQYKCNKCRKLFGRNDNPISVEPGGRITPHL